MAVNRTTEHPESNAIDLTTNIAIWSVWRPADQSGNVACPPCLWLTHCCSTSREMQKIFNSKLPFPQNYNFAVSRNIFQSCGRSSALWDGNCKWLRMQGGLPCCCHMWKACHHPPHKPRHCISPPVCDGARRTAETPVSGKRCSLVLCATSGRGPAHRGHAPLLIVTRADGVTARRCQRPLWKHFWKVFVDMCGLNSVRRYIAAAYVHGVHYDAV